MKLIPCPLVGLRDSSEFTCLGEFKPLVNPSLYDDEAWINEYFMVENRPGITKEWWLHNPTSYWFILERNILTNEIIDSYPANKIYSDRIDYSTSNE